MIPLGTKIQFCSPFISSNVYKYQYCSLFLPQIQKLYLMSNDMLCSEMSPTLETWRFFKFLAQGKWDPSPLQPGFSKPLSPHPRSVYCPNNFYITLVTKIRVFWSMFFILITFWKISFTTFLPLIGPSHKIGLSWIVLNRYFKPQATKHLYL